MTDTLYGRFEDGVHLLPVRVYFEDTDLSGIVYHANYLRYAERGRSDYLRAIGIFHRDLAGGDDPIYYTLRRINLEFERPARIDDEIEVCTVASKVTGARLDMDQLIRDAGSKQVLARVHVQAAYINDEGKPRRAPQFVQEAFKALGPEKIGASLP